MYGQRQFNLKNIPQRASRKRLYTDSEPQNTIPRSSHNVQEESPLGSILIRMILSLTIFSLIMLMRNSTDKTVNICYDALCAWSTANYSIPEEYGIEKFVSAIKNGSLVEVFSPSISYPLLTRPVKGETALAFGEMNNNSACLGTLIGSDNAENVFAAFSGEIAEIGENEALGRYIVLQNGDGIKIVYGCTDEVTVLKGDIVDTDTVLAQMSEGKDGRFYIYIEVQVDGKPVDPEKCFGVEV